MTAARIALLFLSFALAACVAAPAGEAPATGGEVQPAAFAVARPDLGRAAAALPAQAAGFARGQIADLERRYPGRGVGIDYATADRSAAATVAIYDLGQRSVPADPDSPAQRAEFDAAVSELLSLPPERTGRRLANATASACPWQAAPIRLRRSGWRSGPQTPCGRRCAWAARRAVS